MEDNLHSPQRRLIELRIASADVDDLIQETQTDHPDDELKLRRLKSQRQQLHDQIARLEAQLDPPELA